ncbi:glycosyltransferase [Microbacterium sp. ET2]|uniref:glycosyltransferase n=1 Tax=Microbacterium albipurpureum TaxID=3050384 RepID=UPI00259C8292|nr:glycosyltransferase [Microbacterium sp. ET2 (Ac-2212)]WJL94222.1 glycosyltransferase [Microbacterium sp. ET2 (Ac-2212)]
MSTFLITCTPAHGHVMPLLQIARHLVGRGDTVRFLTSPRYAAAVQATGAELVPLTDDADVDLDHADEAYPERVGLTGPAALRFDMSTLFLRPAPAQLAMVRAELAAHPIDAVLTEPLFLGSALALHLPEKERVPVVVLGIFPLGVPSRDTAPFGLGVTPLPGWTGRLRNAMLRVAARHVIFGGVQREADALSRREVGATFGGLFLDWPRHAQAIAQFSVAAFEYPRSDLSPSVHFLGPLTPAASSTPLPDWWDDLNTDRPVVHVTQGTIANSDFDQLVGPTLEALAERNAVVVVSTGGRPVDALTGALPANVRVASYLPYDRLLPLVDVMVTNGGYGGVQQALAAGVPLVVAGQTEDKVEVSARVGWTGAGVNLRTSTPTARAVGEAVERVLREPSFRERAHELAAAYARADGLQGLVSLLQAVVADRRVTAQAPTSPGVVTHE